MQKIHPLQAAVVLAACACQANAAQVRVAPAPPGEPVSSRFQVRVNGRSAPVSTAVVRCIDKVRTATSPEVQLPGEAGFVSFDMDRGPVRVTVDCDRDVAAAKLLPSSYGLTPRISGRTVSFTLNRPGQATLEVNGDWNNSLHIFANPIETPPDSNDANVIYFGPGVHTVQPFTVPSGKSVYVAAGAVIYFKQPAGDGSGACITLDSNTALRGRGIIDGSLLPKPNPYGNLISAVGSRIVVDGVILRDSPSWTFPVRNSQDVRVDNIKIFGWRGNSDGVDICNSSRVSVSDCFFRTFDDNVVIKSSLLDAPPSRDIDVQRCVSWNEIAHPFSLGAELNADCEDITFSDCDIIHDKGREWDLRVYNSGAAHVRNIVWRDIRIEEARRPFSLWIGKSIWVKNSDRGHIDHIVFDHITCAAPKGGHEAADLTAFDADHAIHDVVFSNVTVGGRPLTLSDIKATDNVDGIVVKP